MPTSVRVAANLERESTACRGQVLVLTGMLLAQEAVEWRAFLHPEEPWGLLLLAFSAAAVRGRWHGRTSQGLGGAQRFQSHLVCSFHFQFYGQNRAKHFPIRPRVLEIGFHSARTELGSSNQRSQNL